MLSLADLEAIHLAEKSKEPRVIDWKDGIEEGSGRRFVSDPYAYDIYGEIKNQWMTEQEYIDSCRDI